MAETDEADRFATAARMAEEGIALMRQNLRRRFPDETEEQIDWRLDEWLADRPLDAPGRVVSI